ncbi:hypothetical protein C8Q80DRAFT_1295542 [Daedaleopsis nitida]|nr:hypothetical protein C8Q80DRAFT_1295542 [Daedaleopsis nitida]
MPVPETTTPSPTHDPKYFYSLVDFKVEDVLFRLPSRPFEKSVFFAEMFNKGPESRGIPHPWEMRDTLKASSWDSTMRLATLWSVDTVHEIGYREIESYIKSPAMRFALGMKYDILKNIVPKALTELVAGGVEVDDYQALGIELAVKVMKYRELCRDASNKSQEQGDESRYELMQAVFGPKFVEDVKAVEYASRECSIVRCDTQDELAYY